MAGCNFVDSITMEVLGQATFQDALIDHVIMEVIGASSQLGLPIDIDHLILETLGQMPVFANMDHVTMEIIGEWNQCPSCN
jgi:hypothetical protein